MAENEAKLPEASQGMSEGAKLAAELTQIQDVEAARTMAEAGDQHRTWAAENRKIGAMEEVPGNILPNIQQSENKPAWARMMAIKQDERAEILEQATQVRLVKKPSERVDDIDEARAMADATDEYQTYRAELHQQAAERGNRPEDSGYENVRSELGQENKMMNHLIEGTEKSAQADYLEKKGQEKSSSEDKTA